MSHIATMERNGMEDISASVDNVSIVWSASSDQPLLELHEATSIDAAYCSLYTAYCCDGACDSDGRSHVRASYDQHQQCGTTSVHEFKDRTRVLNRIKHNMINDTDMNARLASDASPESCRSMCRLLGNAWVAPKHTSLQRCTTSFRRMQRRHLSHTDTSLSLQAFLLPIAT